MGVIIDLDKQVMLPGSRVCEHSYPFSMLMEEGKNHVFLKSEINEWLLKYAGVKGTDWQCCYSLNNAFVFFDFRELPTAILFKLTFGGA